jgi:hypothetical protein
MQVLGSGVERCRHERWEPVPPRRGLCVQSRNTACETSTHSRLATSLQDDVAITMG